MKLKPTTILAALGLIGAGGFMAGRVSNSGSSEISQDPPIATRAARLDSSRGNGSVAKGSSNRSNRPDRASTADRKARLESMMRSENPLERNRALLAFINSLGPGDFEEAVAHFRSLGITDSRMGEYGLLLTAWGQADPVAALAYAKENTRGGFAQDTVLTAWGSTDPEAAIRWAQANHQGDDPNPYLPGIIRGLVESDPTRATELMASMPRSEERGKALDFFLPHLLGEGNQATRDWIASLGDEALKSGAMLRAAPQLAATDPAGTASWLLANPSDATDRRMDDVYSAWAQKDVQAAQDSLRTLPAGAIRSNALRGIVSSVATEDPRAAVSLMDQYSGDLNDRVVQNFVWHSFGSDPSIAASQIARITDVGQRDRMYRRTLEAWLDRDPASAQAWIQTNPIPESVRNQLK
jgi:hypothetical protein